MFNLDDSKTVSDVTINSTKNVTTGLIIHSSSTVHGKMTYTDNTTCEADLSINIDSSGVDLSTMAIGGISCSVYYDESGKMTYGYVFNFKEHNDYGSFHARWGLGVGDYEYNSVKFNISAASLTFSPMILTASRLIPARVEPTLTEEQTKDVSFNALGIELMSSKSPGAKPFWTRAL